MPKVLVILADGFEEIEAITPVDLLRRAGAAVTLACVGEALSATGRNGVVVQAEFSLAAVENLDFDCVVLPGGPGAARLRTDARVRELVQRQHRAKRWLAAICAAPTVLHDAGVLAGHRFTAHFSVESELPALLREQRVVVDRNIVTSRGAGTALDFGLELVARLFSPDKAREISAAICF